MAKTKTRTYEQSGIPKDELDDEITIAKADPRYVSHEVIKEKGGTFTLRVTIAV